MAKITLSDLSNLQNETTATGTINANNALLETAIENTLSRDGTTPNTMMADFDMNSYQILNLPEPVDDNDPVRLIDLGNAAGYATAAAASATAAASSATSAASSATSATSSATSATSSASAASTSATSAASSATTAAANATVVVGHEYSFATSTTMADPGTGLIRFDNATLSSAANIAISALTNDTGNPNIRTFIASWDDSSNTALRGTLTFRNIGTPATFAIFNITGALTDNTTWLQLAVTYVTGNGTFAASDRVSVQFTRAGDKGADGSGVGDFTSTVSTSVDGEVVLFSGTTGKSGKRATGTGLAVLTSGVLSASTTSTAATLGTIELGAATDTTLSRSSAGVLAVEGNTVPVNSTSQAATFGTVELGHASDTTLSRSSAGILAVEGVTIPRNSLSDTATINAIELGHATDTTLSRSAAGQLAVEAGAGSLYVTSIEVGHASDTTITRSSAGAIAVEGVAVSINSTGQDHTCNTLELGNASDTTLSRVSAGVIAVEGSTVPTVTVANAWSAGQYYTLATLTDGANVAWNGATQQKAKVTLGGNRTISAMTNPQEGGTYTIWVFQDATGSRTLTWTSSGAGSYDFGAAGAPTLTTTASKADVLVFEGVTIGGTLKLRYTGIAKQFT